MDPFATEASAPSAAFTEGTASVPRAWLGSSGCSVAIVPLQRAFASGVLNTTEPYALFVSLSDFPFAYALADRLEAWIVQQQQLELAATETPSSDESDWAGAASVFWAGQSHQPAAKAKPARLLPKLRQHQDWLWWNDLLLRGFRDGGWMGHGKFYSVVDRLIENLSLLVSGAALGRPVRLVFVLDCKPFEIEAFLLGDIWQLIRRLMEEAAGRHWPVSLWISREAWNESDQEVLINQLPGNVAVEAISPEPDLLDTTGYSSLAFYQFNSATPQSISALYEQGRIQEATEIALTEDFMAADFDVAMLAGRLLLKNKNENACSELATRLIDRALPSTLQRVLAHELSGDAHCLSGRLEEAAGQYKAAWAAARSALIKSDAGQTENYEQTPAFCARFDDLLAAQSVVLMKLAGLAMGSEVWEAAQRGLCKAIDAIKKRMEILCKTDDASAEPQTFEELNVRRIIARRDEMLARIMLAEVEAGAGRLALAREQLIEMDSDWKELLSLAVALPQTAGSPDKFSPKPDQSLPSSAGVKLVISRDFAQYCSRLASLPVFEPLHPEGSTVGEANHLPSGQVSNSIRKSWLERAADAYRSLVRDYGQRYELLSDFSSSLFLLAEENRAAGKREESVLLYRQSVITLKRARAQVPAGQDHDPKSDFDLSVRLIRLGDALRGSGDTAERIELYEQAIALKRLWVGASSQDAANADKLADLAAALDRLADARLSARQTEQAELLLEEAVEYQRRVLLAKGDLPSLLRSGGVMMLRLADAVAAVGSADSSHLSKAIVRYQRAQALFEKAISKGKESPTALRDLAISLERRGDVLLASGKTQEAADVYSQTLKLRKRALELTDLQYGPARSTSEDSSASASDTQAAMAANGSAELREDLATCYERQARVALAQGQPVEAAAYLTDALWLQQGVIARFGKSPSRQVRLGALMNFAKKIRQMQEASRG